MGGIEYEVEGTAWMDHELFTDSLLCGRVGWDRISNQFDDSTDLMLYGLRDTDGRYGELSSGTLVGTEGQVLNVTSGNSPLTPWTIWSSTETGANYPVEWPVEVRARESTFDVRARRDAQEVTR